MRIMEYLEFLEKTYVIHRLPAFAGPDKAASLGKKLYFFDNGIASILAQSSEGALFENAIFNQLHPYGQLSYLSKGNDDEVDFLLSQPGNAPAALEVKYHPLAGDQQKIQRIAHKHHLGCAWVVGRCLTPGFEDFLWCGAIF
jgi:predicted AAA+ superfamily ATPase